MRIEKDFIGEVSLPRKALYGIHSYRARENFPLGTPFPQEWFRAAGIVKLACYRTISKLVAALRTDHPDLLNHLRLPDEKIMGALKMAAGEVVAGSHFDNPFRRAGCCVGRYCCWP